MIAARLIHVRQNLIVQHYRPLLVVGTGKKLDHLPPNILGWEHAIRGMRNPKNSWAKSDSGPECPYGKEKCCGECQQNFCIGPNDKQLMMALRNAGTDHRKFMRMITVYLDITAPLYWWKEFDTYKVGTVANSCSTMHKIAAKEFTLDDFSHEHLVDDLDVRIEIGGTDHRDTGPMEVLGMTIDVLNHYREKYIAATKTEEYTGLPAKNFDIFNFQHLLLLSLMPHGALPSHKVSRSPHHRI